jgi:aryl-alcohol dehydrogenase-like predicted oxidoreductase
LTAEKLLESASASLKALKVERVPIYLLRVPEDRIPVSETMKAIQHLYEEGHFEKVSPLPFFSV